MIFFEQVSSIAAAANQPFMDLFGPPIKTSLVDSPKKHKNKVSGVHEYFTSSLNCFKC